MELRWNKGKRQQDVVHASTTAGHRHRSPCQPTTHTEVIVTVMGEHLTGRSRGQGPARVQAVGEGATDHRGGGEMTTRGANLTTGHQEGRQEPRHRHNGPSKWGGRGRIPQQWSACPGYRSTRSLRGMVGVMDGGE